MGHAYFMSKMWYYETCIWTVLGNKFITLDFMNVGTLILRPKSVTIATNSVGVATKNGTLY